MTDREFKETIGKEIKHCSEILIGKSGEYSIDTDKLHNFRAAARLEGVEMTTALAGMMAKHTISIYDMLAGMEKGFDYSREQWQEKITDHINYLLLLWATLEESYADN